jgi:hypothetical protein
MRSMRALSFFFALMVGLVLAFLAPAMAGGEPTAPEAMIAPQTSLEAVGGSESAGSTESVDTLAIDLRPTQEFDAAPAVDGIA